MASLADQLPEQSSSAKRETVSWTAIAWFAGLLILVYFPILFHLVEQWSTDEDVGHGFFVPAVAGYIAWTRREQLQNLTLQPARWGIVVMLWGALQGYIGWLGAELFLQRSAILISLVGLLLVLGGAPLIKALAFPLALLPFMIPFPAVIYNQITFPLQLFASQVAEIVLGWVGIPVLRDGNVLELASQKLSVVEACSGIRSLMSLTFLSLVYAYFFDKKVWMRWALLIGTIPIAILANSFRVTITGILSEIDTDLARGFFHTLEGWVVFLIAGALLIVVHACIHRIGRLWAKAGGRA